jgi:hypothetical protein
MASREVELPPPPVPHPAVTADDPVRTGETVTVACKLPAGLILRCFEWEKFKESTRDGLQDSKRAREKPEMRFVVRGTWVGSAGQAFARNNPAVAELLPGGFALTPGCPKEIWDLWFEQNKESALVKNRVIFAHPEHASVVKSAQDHRAVTSGLEPVHPDNPGERLGGVDRRLRAVGQLVNDEGTTPR